MARRTLDLYDLDFIPVLLLDSLPASCFRSTIFEPVSSPLVSKENPSEPVRCCSAVNTALRLVICTSMSSLLPAADPGRNILGHLRKVSFPLMALEIGCSY